MNLWVMSEATWGKWEPCAVEQVTARFVVAVVAERRRRISRADLERDGFADAGLSVVYTDAGKDRWEARLAQDVADAAARRGVYHHPPPASGRITVVEEKGQAR